MSADAGRSAAPAGPVGGDLTLAAFQRAVEAAFLDRDRRRGLAGTFVWFVEEVGELARAVKSGDPANLREEFGDVLAWLSTLASLCGVDLAEAAAPYARGCPTCHASPCRCPLRPTAVGPFGGPGATPA